MSFSDDCKNIHNKDCSGQLSLVTDKLTQCVNDKIRCKQTFRISKSSDNFSEMSCTVLSDIVTEKLHYHKICARLVPKMLTEAHKNQRMAVARKFLDQYRAEGEGIVYLKRTATENETWILYINTDIKQQL